MLPGATAGGVVWVAATRLGAVFTLVWNIASIPIVMVLVAIGIALVYYLAPNVEQHWRWVTPGSVVALVLWLAASLGLRFYVTNFANYNATYGSIGGVILLMLWLYLSGMALLLGAEVNSEIEHAAAGRLEQAGERARIDARQRDEGEQAEQDQRAEREPQPLLEIGGLGEIRQAQIGGHIVGCGCHVRF